MDTTTRSWWPFVLMALVVLVALASSATPTPLYVDYQQAWGTSGAVITVVYAVYSLAVLIPLLFLGRVSDAIGRRPVILAGLALMTASMVVLAAAPSAGWLIAGRAVQGLGVGLITGSAAAALIELHPRRDPRIGALTSSATTNFGIAAGVLLAGVVASTSSSPLVHPYAVIGVAGVALAIGVAVSVPETAGGGRETLRQALRVMPPSVPAQVRSTFLLAAVCVITSWSVGGVFLGLGGALARDMVGRADYLVTGLVVASLQAAAAAAQLVWNLRAGPSLWRRGVMLGVGCLIAGLAAASVALEIGVVAGFVAAALVTGIGMGLLFLMGTTLVAQSAPPAERGRVFSALFVVAYLALGLPAVVAALLADVVGLVPAYHLLALVVTLVAAGALVTVVGSRPAGGERTD